MSLLALSQVKAKPHSLLILSVSNHPWSLYPFTHLALGTLSLKLPLPATSSSRYPSGCLHSSRGLLERHFPGEGFLTTLCKYHHPNSSLSLPPYLLYHFFQDFYHLTHYYMYFFIDCLSLLECKMKKKVPARVPVPGTCLICAMYYSKEGTRTNLFNLPNNTREVLLSSLSLLVHIKVEAQGSLVLVQEHTAHQS